MRLIDADKIGLTDFDIVMISSEPDKWRNACQVIIEKISRAPSVDAVPVVRCKDCKYHEDEEPGMVYCPNQVSGWVSEDFFCKDGERRTE